MDDPWANTWGESDKPALPEITTSHSWTNPAHNDEQETDIAVPSWSTGAGVQWAEPSANQDTLWGAVPESAQAWGSSPYENISIGSKASLPTHPDTELSDTNDTSYATPTEGSEAGEPVPVVVVPLSPKSSPSLPLPSEPVLDTSHLSSPAAISLPASRSASPDAFGTFEEGVQLESEATWSSPPGVADSADNWGSAWTAPAPESIENASTEKQLDGMELAKQQKEKQDRAVPPEFLPSILQIVRRYPKSYGLSQMFKAPGTTGKKIGEQECTELASQYIPEGMVLPPPIQFGKTAIGSSMSEAVKLTRHVPLARSSPMSLYIASKGSVSWEASVKNRKEVIKDDLPVGWRILDKDEEVKPASQDIGKPKKQSGLLSFWGRRNSASPTVEAQPQVSASPVATPSTSTPAPTRSSMDSVKSLPITTTLPPISSTAPSSSSSAAPAYDQPVTADATSNSTLTSQVDLTSPTSPAPSAVSRFLNRFSRSKSNSTSQRQSLALSSDDIEFLSDLVPSASDDVGEEDHNHQLRALSSMIQSSPLPTKLPPPIAPPPAAPPRRPSATSSPLSSNNSGAFIRGDFNDFFDPFSMDVSSPQASTAASHTFPSNPLIPTSPTPILQASMVPSRPHTPAAPSPLSGKPKVEVPRARMSTILSPVERRSSPLTFPPPHPPSLVAIPPPPRPASRSSPSVIPPPPPGPSRSQTPKPLQAPPSAFDDDEFSEFHAPPPISPSQKQSFHRSEPSYDDDDFADFHSALTSPPSHSRQLRNKYATYDSSFSSSISSNQNLFDQSKRLTDTSGFDDFDDLVSAAVPSPTPPRPPSKSPSHLTILSSPSPAPAKRGMTPSPPPPPASHHKKRPSLVSSTEHSRILGLVEQAASRQGRWPAPPSPLPQALSPPPGTKAFTTASGIDLFDDDLPLAMRMKEVTYSRNGSPTPGAELMSVSSVNGLGSQTLTPPPAFPSVFEFSKLAPAPPVKQLLVSNNLTASTSNSASTKGGLSAQDLSFFEGL